MDVALLFFCDRAWFSGLETWLREMKEYVTHRVVLVESKGEGKGDEGDSCLFVFCLF
jgi:hypothetical protein